MFVACLRSACTSANVLCKHLSGLQLLATERHNILVLLPNASNDYNDQPFLDNWYNCSNKESLSYALAVLHAIHCLLSIVSILH